MLHNSKLSPMLFSVIHPFWNSMHLSKLIIKDFSPCHSLWQQVQTPFWFQHCQMFPLPFLSEPKGPATYSGPLQDGCIYFQPACPTDTGTAAKPNGGISQCSELLQYIPKRVSLQPPGKLKVHVNFRCSIISCQPPTLTYCSTSVTIPMTAEYDSSRAAGPSGILVNALR